MCFGISSQMYFSKIARTENTSYLIVRTKHGGGCSGRVWTKQTIRRWTGTGDAATTVASSTRIRSHRRRTKENEQFSSWNKVLIGISSNVFSLHSIDAIQSRSQKKRKRMNDDLLIVWFLLLNIQTCIHRHTHVQYYIKEGGVSVLFLSYIRRLPSFSFFAFDFFSSFLRVRRNTCLCVYVCMYTYIQSYSQK